VIIVIEIAMNALGQTMINALLVHLATLSMKQAPALKIVLVDISRIPIMKSVKSAIQAVKHVKMLLKLSAHPVMEPSRSIMECVELLVRTTKLSFHLLVHAKLVQNIAQIA
jgi:hypothetical protein